MKDEVFKQDNKKQFEFDESVASVFDDMLVRSIPFYDEVRALIIALILKDEVDGKNVLDLGSSTAKFLLDLYSSMSTKMNLCGIDNSKAMLEQAKIKIRAYKAEIELKYGDIITYKYPFGQDFIIANYTLQFIRPLQRGDLVKKIYNSLNNGGYFIFSEKIIFKDKKLDRAMIDIYYDHKKARGYSDYEISKKREALENVLIPYTISENIAMCKEAGFDDVETIFQWSNFATLVARKA
ncbi:MAG: carboxy-S-adenosyl-L-methionine synthase CmoA [Campylobacterales bacterium]|nr:carboxy-S-adenosyl-L-methionine synthase CmoA [Campylobacterales bacterium]